MREEPVNRQPSTLASTDPWKHDSLCSDTREGGKTNIFTGFCFSLQTWDSTHVDKERKTGLVRGFHQQRWFRSIRVPVILCWGELALSTKLRVYFHLTHNVSILLAFHVVQCDFTAHIQDPDESGGALGGIRRSEVARNLPSLYLLMHLWKLISYRRHTATSQEHKWLPEHDREISLLR